MKGNPILLEPYDKIVINTSEEYLGAILGDLSKRRGRILSTQESNLGNLDVTALVPQKEILEYANELKSLTKGTGFFNLSFYSYEQVPPVLQEQIIKEFNSEKR